MAAGKIGFFWVVADIKGKDVVLVEAIGLAEAELDGSALTHSGGHYDCWETMRSRGAPYIRSRGLSMALLQSEYEEWPRGRIVFHTGTLRFSLLADRRLHTPERIGLIRDEFNLPKDSFDIHLDGHYIQTTNSSIVDDW